MHKTVDNDAGYNTASVYFINNIKRKEAPFTTLCAKSCDWSR